MGSRGKEATWLTEADLEASDVEATDYIWREIMERSSRARKRQTEVARDGQADEFDATCHEAFCKLSQVSQVMSMRILMDVHVYRSGMGPLLRNASITNNTHYWEESPITTLIIITEDCKSINFITSSLIMRQRCIHYYCHYSLMNLSLIQSHYQLLLSLWVLSPLHYPLSLLNHRKVPSPLLSHY